MIRTAVIPAGGYGSRMQPITRAVPKPMLSIVNRPVIHYVVEEAAMSGMDRVIIVAGFRSGVIRDYFLPDTEYDRRSYQPIPTFDGIDIQVIEQDEPRGLADSIVCASDLVGGEPFAVLLGDDILRSEVPVTRQIVDRYRGDNTVGVLRVREEEARNYGMVVPSDGDEVSRIVEKPQSRIGTDLACCGRYALRGDMMEVLRDSFRERGTSAGIADSINDDLSAGRATRYVELDGIRYDTGNPEAFRRTLLAAITEGW